MSEEPTWGEPSIALELSPARPRIRMHAAAQLKRFFDGNKWFSTKKPLVMGSFSARLCQHEWLRFAFRRISAVFAIGLVKFRATTGIMEAYPK
jgi:hypothetical protein